MDLDLIFSIGPACRPAYHLKQNFLRLFACPLDWQMAYSLDTCLSLFQNSFETFFLEIEEDENNKGANNNRRIIDTKNSITSIHHFPSTLSLFEGQQCFRSTMLKRYQNLNTAILNAHTVGILCNRTDSIESLSTFLTAFGNIYPNQNFVLINIRSTTHETPLQEQNYILNSRLTIKEYSFYDIYDSFQNSIGNTWIGNVTQWNTLLNNYRLTAHPTVKYLRNGISSGKSIILYGAGTYCQKILPFLTKYDICVSGIAVTSTIGNPNFINQIPVYPISFYENQKDSSIILISIYDSLQAQEICTCLKKNGFKEVISIHI